MSLASAAGKQPWKQDCSTNHYTVTLLANPQFNMPSKKRSAPTAGQKAANAKKRKATRKHRAAGKKATVTRKRRAAAKKAAATRRREWEALPPFPTTLIE